MRKVYLLCTVAAVAALAVAGCAGSPSGGGSSPSATGGASRPLVMTDAGGATFVQNFNVFSPTATGSAAMATFIYEPLLGVNREHPSEYIPWLAQSYSFSDGGKTLVFNLRHGVKWSNGTTLTSADVVYSLDEYKSIIGEPWTSVSAAGPYTVDVNFTAPAYQQLALFGDSSTLLIVPKAIWSKENARTWTDPDPVGTGPLVLTKFTPQAVFFTMRSDYWGGPGKGVKTVEIVTSTNIATVQNEMTTNQMAWTSAGFPDETTGYISSDPATHLYGCYSTGTVAGPEYNVTRAPFNNVDVRIALRDALSMAEIDSAVYMGCGHDGSVTGLDPSIWSNLMPSQYASYEQQDVAAAKQALAASGYKVVGGNLVKDGKTYPITFNSISAYSSWVSASQLIAAQWKSVLGLNVNVNQMGVNAFSQADSDGDFQFDFNPEPINGGNSPDAAYEVYSTLNYKPTGQEALENTGRFTSPQLQTLLNEYAATPASDTAKLAAIDKQEETIVAEQAPFIPLEENNWIAAMNATYWGGWPGQTTTYIPNPTLSPDAIETLMHVYPK